MNSDDWNFLSVETAVCQSGLERATDPAVGVIGDVNDGTVLILPFAFPRHRWAPPADAD
jgi:hypothetical protein